jgi:organic radical activating enzyme
MDDANTNKQFRVYDSTGTFMRMSIDEAIARGVNRWQTWKCSAGVRGLYIDYDGNLWICNTASSNFKRFNEKGWIDLLKKEGRGIHEQWPGRETLAVEYRKTPEAYIRELPKSKIGESTLPGFIGNINEGFELPKTWYSCPWSACACGADVILSKSNNDDNKKLLAVTNDEFRGRDITRNNLVENIVNPVAVEMNFPIKHQILWDLGRRCNYDCSYCWSYVHNRTDLHKDFDLLIKTVDKIVAEWSHGETIRWNFGGGEPTLHPKFLNLLEHLKSKNQWTMVTSNGTRDHKYWAQAVQYLNSINLSAHFDGLRDDDDENRFVKNINVICQHFDEHDDDHWIEIKLMAPPQYINRALKLKDKILNLGTLDKPGANNRIKGVVSMVPIRSLGDSGTLVQYTDQQIEIFAKQ